MCHGYMPGNGIGPFAVASKTKQGYHLFDSLSHKIVVDEPSLGLSRELSLPNKAGSPDIRNTSVPSS